jgi:general stress protein CsbA
MSKTTTKYFIIGVAVGMTANYLYMTSMKGDR